MEPGAQSYVVFLVIGTALVFVDGWLLRRAGTTYLASVYPDRSVAASVNKLISVLFHLSVLGVLALLSTAEFNIGSTIETLVARIGVMLLVLAFAHAVTIGVLAKIRARQREQRLKAELSAQAEERLEQDQS